VIKLLFLMAISIFALNDATVPYTFSTGEKVLASQFNSNFDTLETWISRTNDSIDEKFIRFSDLNGGDSTLRVDTVYGGSSVWTGISIIDSLVVTKQIQGNLKGAVVGNVIGNVTGNLTGNVTGNASGTAATVTGAAQTAITSVGTLTGLTVSGTSTFDSTRHRTITTSGIVSIGNDDASAVIRTGGANTNISITSMGANGSIRLLAGGVANGTLSNREVMRADGTSGNVGIDTTAPKEKLHVKGNIKADTLKGAVIGNVTGNTSGTAATVTGAAQAAITSVGTLTGLTMGGNITTSTNDIITDSIFARTLTTSGNVNTGSGDVTTDSIYARTIKTSGNIQADTLKGVYVTPTIKLTGTARTFVETIRDTTITTDATINLFSAASIASYVGEIEISIGTLRNVKKAFSWYGQNGLAAVDTVTVYDIVAGDASGITIALVSGAGSPGTLGVRFAGVGGSLGIAMYLRYTKTY